MKALSLRSSPSLPRSPSPYLPEEIVSDILVLTWDGYNPNALLDLYLLRTSANSASSPSTIILNSKTARTLSAHTRLLCNYALVSRTWPNATLPLLYAHVIILSHKQALLFARTLKYSPTLVRMVKEISYVILAASQFNMLRWLRIELQTEPLAGEMVIPVSVANLALSIVYVFQHLKAFHLCIPHKNPNDGFFTSRGSRELTVHGHFKHGASLSPPSLMASFPLLEVLCLHKTVAGQPFTLPYLPRLPTLRFLEASLWQS